MAVARRLAVVVFACLLPTLVSAQSILTVAGGGTDDGHQATDVGLFGPSGLAFDRAGNLYLVETYANLVRKVAPDGTIVTVAGNSAAGSHGDGGPALKASLNRPVGLAIDTNGDLYIADVYNGKIRKITVATGIITTFAGGGNPATGVGDGGPANQAVLDGPFGLWLTGGNLYVTELGYGGNRVRKISLATSVITTVAGPQDGSIGNSGDGGPATAAKFYNPEGVAVDAAGDIFVADTYNHVVRRIDGTTGIVTTYAGGGNPATGTGDGGPATQAKLQYPDALTFDLNGNLLVSEASGIRKIDKSTQIISTITTELSYNDGMIVAPNGDLYVSTSYDVARIPAGTTEIDTFAGGGSYVGDGLPATAAVVRDPQGIAIDGSGNLFFGDPGNGLIREVDAKSGLISTYAGPAGYYDSGPDGQPATQSAVGAPSDLAFDPQGNLYVADEANDRIKRIDRVTGILTYYAGGGSPSGANDGLPATQAKLTRPVGITFDPQGNLYIADADTSVNKIWKVDATTHVITTFAGNGKEGFAGDGGPATAAELDTPVSVVSDAAGNIYISDYLNSAIRKVTHDGVINTIAGHVAESGPPFGDGGPAAQAYVSPEHMTVDAAGNLYIADDFSSRIRKIDAKTGIISTVAGAGTAYYIDADFAGDNGPANQALLNFAFELSGVAVDPAGDLFISDSANNRVRAVYACVNVAAPQLTQVPNGTVAPALTWTPVSGAFRYDVLLDTVSPPQHAVASDFTETSFSPSNLASGTTYYWSVTAKGDPFCPSVSTAASAISTFTTAGGCAVGAFNLTAPADGQQHVPIVAPSSVALSWQAAAGAVSYDVYLGTTNPPNLVASGVTGTSYNAAVTSGTIYWFVVAHSSCGGQTATSSIRSFSTDVAACLTAPNVTIVSPADGATGQPATVNLTWSGASSAVSAFDVYFGTSSPPPLLRSGLGPAVQSLTVSFLDTGTKYYWNVIAHSACGLTPATTPIVSFTTISCTAPGATQFLFTPASVSSGATYTVVWSPAAGLDADGGYLIERSTSPSFSTILDSQVSSSTAATFVAGSPGTYYHRVRAIPSCDPAQRGPVSAAASISVVSTPANIIVTVQPQALVTALGDKIEDHVGSFTLENIGDAPAEIIVGQAELPGSRPFFSITQGGAFVTLQPRVPQSFTIQYSGPPNNVSGSYQGVVFAVGVNQPLPVTPYAFVNLKIGGGPAVTPQFLINGASGNYASFPGFSGSDDSNRPPLAIVIDNPGTMPMDLSAEVGPEVWLVPQNGWNAQPLAPGETRTVNLSTRRPFAPSGSPLPRYTYFTVRTKDGASARLLVQDNDQIAVSSGRATALDANARSFIVPDAKGRLRLTNNGSDAVNAELIFTPVGFDGFDPNAVKRAVVVVPPNDVVTLTSPAAQLFGVAAGTLGQIEVRIPVNRLGLIAVTADAPVVTRGEGARIGTPQIIYLTSAMPTTLTLAETTGADHAAVSIVTDTQTITQDIPRYGIAQINAGSPTHIQISVTSGGGSVIGVATLGSAQVVSSAIGATLARKMSRLADNGVTSVTTVVPVLSGVTSAGAAPAFTTSVGMISPSSAATFWVTFNPEGGGVTFTQSIPVAAGVVTVFPNALHDLFGLSPVDGNLSIQGPPDAKVYAVLETSTGGSAPAPASTLPLPTTFSEAVTGATAAAQRSLSYDGLEQSVDPSRGSRWLLLLNELAGGSGSVDVRLYESGNRSTPIAEKSFNIGADEQVKLDTVFSSLGLTSADRQKDRTNVEVVVTAMSGTAQVAASAVSIDNVTGATKVVPLAPAIGSGNPNINFAAPVLNTPPPPPPRHRAVGH